MNVISIDLPWNPNSKARRALAIVNPDRNIEIKAAENDDELLRLIQDHAEQESIILLDIPIEGCDQIEIKKFRPIDKTLAQQGIWTLPASRAKNRGKSLKRYIHGTNQGKKTIVQEIYPYAIYKFLAYLEDSGLLPRLTMGKFDTLLEDGFRRFVPPRYKRERDKDKRLEKMKYLYSLLTDSNIGLKFLTPLDYPDSSYSRNRLNSLADEYDACLGAIVGICWVERNPYAWIAGDPKSGEILVLADKWLKEQLKEKQIQMRRENALSNC
jgi:predicted nuclease with RNAse H fold